MNEIPLARRQALLAAGFVAGAGILVACAGNEDKPAAASRDDAGDLANTADVPLGSALIVDELVLTQPEAGVFTAFSAICPHAGCTVSEVEGAQVVCPCHGSIFGLDGSVLSGPATQPLTPAAITVRGDSIVAG